jgi:hypothetical protein
VDAVLVVQVDGLRTQALEALLDLGAQPLDTAAGVVATLGRDEQVVGVGRERRADRPLALPARVQMGGVEWLSSVS